MPGNSSNYDKESYVSEPISMKTEDLERISHIAFLRPEFFELNRRGELNKSKVVREVLKEFEQRLEARQVPQTLTAEDVLQHLFRFFAENEAWKADLTKMTGVTPHHWAGPVQERLDEANHFIGQISQMKNDRIIGRVIDDFLDNTEFLLHAHIHSQTEDFIAHISKVSPPAKEALKGQLYYSLMLAKAAPERPYAKRFMQTFNELLEAEHLNNLRDDSQAMLKKAD